MHEKGRKGDSLQVRFSEGCNRLSTAKAGSEGKNRKVLGKISRNSLHVSAATGGYMGALVVKVLTE